jgi:uncharacterized protein
MKQTNRSVGTLTHFIIKCTALSFVAVLLGAIMPNIQMVIAQDADELKTTVRLAGRTTNQQHIQLRLFPDRRELMQSSVREGFIVERRSGNSNFTEIGRLKTYDQDSWRALNQLETDQDRAKEIGLAFIFLQSLQNSQGTVISFDQGIAELEERKSAEELAYFGFIVSSLKSTQIAEALGLSFTDNQVQPGQTYTYRVRPVQSPEIYTYTPTEFTITVGADTANYLIDVDVYEGDGYLSFNWDESDKVAGVIVERKAPGEAEFRALMREPLFTLQPEDLSTSIRSSFADSNLVNYSTYSYRFYGYTIFGDLVQFAELSASPRDRTPPEAPFMPVPEHISPREVKVSWVMNDIPAPDLMGFVVGRSHSNEGEFKLLHAEYLPKEARSFIDTTFVPGILNYYVVQALDTAMNISSSFPMAVTFIDSIPPIKPVFMSSSVDSTGRVSLVLLRNPETDLMGYRLFRANDPEHEFSHFVDGFTIGDSLSTTVQTEFFDTITLNSLTPAIYYKAQALDFNYNGSEFSDIMVVSRPDTIPPTTPVIYNIISHTDRIELHYYSSESSDLERQEVYRKTDLDAPWLYLATIPATEAVYIDRNVDQGRVYYYSIRAIDKANLFSDYSFAVYGSAYDDGFRPAVEQIESSIVEGAVQLKWEYDSRDWDVFYVVYRQNQDGIFEQHARTDVPSYTEKISIGSRTVFAIRAYTSDGGQSPLSREIVVLVD